MTRRTLFEVFAGSVLLVRKQIYFSHKDWKTQIIKFENIQKIPVGEAYEVKLNFTEIPHDIVIDKITMNLLYKGKPITSKPFFGFITPMKLQTTNSLNVTWRVRHPLNFPVMFDTVKFQMLS